MTILTTLFWNLLVPAGLSGATIALARRVGRVPSSGRRARWGVAAGLGLGYLAGDLGILGWPSFFSSDAQQVIAWLALASMVLGLVEASWALPRPASWGIRGLFVAAALGLLLRTKWENDWGPAESAGWLGGLWATVLVSWWNLEAQAERLTGPGWLIPLGLVAAGWAVVQVLSKGASFGQLDGVLASTLLGALTTVGLRPGLALSKGGSAVASTVLAGLGLAGYFYSNVPASAALILVVAPWAPWVDRIGFIRRRSYWTRASMRILAVLLTVGLAVFLAGAGSLASLEVESGP